MFAQLVAQFFILGVGTHEAKPSTAQRAKIELDVEPGWVRHVVQHFRASTRSNSEILVVLYTYSHQWSIMVLMRNRRFPYIKTLGIRTLRAVGTVSLSDVV